MSEASAKATINNFDLVANKANFPTGGTLQAIYQWLYTDANKIIEFLLALQELRHDVAFGSSTNEPQDMEDTDSPTFSTLTLTKDLPTGESITNYQSVYRDPINGGILKFETLAQLKSRLGISTARTEQKVISLIANTEKVVTFAVSPVFTASSQWNMNFRCYTESGGYELPVFLDKIKRNANGFTVEAADILENCTMFYDVYSIS